MGDAPTALKSRARPDRRHSMTTTRVGMFARSVSELRLIARTSTSALIAVEKWKDDKTCLWLTVLVCSESFRTERASVDVDYQVRELVRWLRSIGVMHRSRRASCSSPTDGTVGYKEYHMHEIAYFSCLDSWDFRDVQQDEIHDEILHIGPSL